MTYEKLYFNYNLIVINCFIKNLMIYILSKISLLNARVRQLYYNNQL